MMDAGGTDSSHFTEEISLPQVNDTPLNEDELFDVQTALTPLTSKWKQIGSALRIKIGRLEEIESNHPNDAAGCLYDVLTDWLKRNYDYQKFGEPSWRRIVEVVDSPAAGANRALARTIAKEHKIMEPVPPLVSKLKSKLEFLNEVASSEDSKMKESKEMIIQGNIHNFIEASVRSGTSNEDIEKALSQMYSKELLISKPVFEKALKDVKKQVAAKPNATSNAEDENETEPEPLFCEDTVYHASLCSLAVSTRDVSNYEHFFNSEYPQHSLEQVSLSRIHDEENIYRYLIARQDKTYYVALQSVPLLSEWEEKFSSFADGIFLQGERIPLRFFVRQLHDGCRIVFTGFSFGGLLGLYLTAAMWKLPLLTADVLKENVTCISFGQPLINLPLVKEVIEESPEFASTVHSVFTRDDLVPRVSKFLNTWVDELCADVVLDMEEGLIKKHLATNIFQGSITSTLCSCLKILQDPNLKAKDSKGSQSASKFDFAVKETKSMLKTVLPILLVKNGLKQHANPGKSYLMEVESVMGLVWRQLQPAEIAEFTLPNISLIDSLEPNLFQNHKVSSYHLKVIKSYIKYLPPINSNIIPFSQMQAIEPSVNSVAFHRFGKEIAVTVKGDNLWFCYRIQVGPHKEKVAGIDVSKKSIQFNVDPDEQPNISFDSDYVKVVLSSPFCHPVREAKVGVKHKVYTFTYRQEQLAKLTPSELIEVAYLSALLEQHPHSEIQSLSDRFETLRDFLEKVVKVVPIESVFHSFILYDKKVNSELLSACTVALSHMNLKPSLALISTVQKVLSSKYGARASNENPALAAKLSESYDSQMKEHSDKYFKMAYGKKGQKLHKGSTMNPLHKIAKQEEVKSLVATMTSIETSQSLLSEEEYSIFSRVIKWHSAHAQQLKNLQLLCGGKLEQIFPISGVTSSTTAGLKTPLQILREGKQKLSWLAKQNTESNVVLPSESKIKLSELYNSKMLKIVNDIRNKEVKLCCLLLGAFMEEQVRVPLVKSSLDTAKALNFAKSAAAVGVWAIFSLALGDMQAVLDSIPSRSLLVQVKEYIKGIFKEEVAFADEKYAGKLQFMVQSLDNTVSCNSHYVSYSLERQLIELCKTLKINETTPLETLIQDWDQIFKDNILSLVIPTHRSLIASWLKWALMVHNLREELARYTAVGVVGLVNSGKSLLVSTLFNVKVPVGTTAIKRTTVPFLYNLDGCIDGLDVVDFPGVDDRDETIPDLAELLLSLSQIVVFVVDYRKAHTESAKKWLELLEDKSVPVLVCLTYADKLYAEHMSADGSHPDPTHFKQELEKECSMVIEQLGQVPSHEVRFFSFCQDKDSVLNTPDGRQRLKDAGIGSPQDVGDWIAHIFESQMDQDDLAGRVRSFVHRKN